MLGTRRFLQPFQNSIDPYSLAIEVFSGERRMEEAGDDEDEDEDEDDDDDEDEDEDEDDAAAAGGDGGGGRWWWRWL